MGRGNSYAGVSVGETEPTSKKIGKSRCKNCLFHCQKGLEVIKTGGATYRGKHQSIGVFSEIKYRLRLEPWPNSQGSLDVPRSMVKLP